MHFDFEWDEAKARGNSRKHGVTFEEARTVFLDPLSVVFVDPNHSTKELREILVGHSRRGRLLLVSFTARDGRVRMISARPATTIERQDYEEGI